MSKYLPISIYRDDLPDCTAGGASSDRAAICLVPCPDGHVKECEIYGGKKVHILDFYPAVFNGVQAHFKPRSIPAGKWTMFGGNFAYTSDSRFSKQYGSSPIAIHDRVEG